MPTIVRFAGYRVVIYPNDHRPEHVHVIGKGVEAVFEVNCPNGGIELRENCGATRRQVSQIRRQLKPFQDRICAAWKETHGER
jgi:hypothetical protein